LPGPTNPSAVLGPGNNKWSIPVACFEPRIGRDVEVIFVDPVNRYQGNYVLLIGAAPCTVPPVVVEPPGVCSTSFLYVVPASVAVTTMNPAYFTFPVPAEPFLVGFQFCVQGASGRTDGCIVATDGVRVTIQP
jgi:hypothetical protein